MRLRDKESALDLNVRLASKLKARKTKRIFISTVCVLLALILVLGGAVYAAGYFVWGHMHHETMDTSVDTSLAELRRIILEQGDYTGTDFSPEVIAEVKRGIILDELDSYISSRKDYRPVCALLDVDINADLSSLDEEYYKNSSYSGAEVLEFCRRAFRFGCSDLLRREPVTAPPETTSPDTPPSDTTGPDGETTGPDSETTAIPGGIVMDDPPPEPTPITGVSVSDEDVYNILLLGVDSRGEDFTGRTDTIMVVSINRASKRIVLTSFWRDLKVYDPSYGWTKINNVYARAGSIGKSVGRLATTLKHNFNIDIHNYVIVNFVIFEKVVDILGGVDVPMYYGEYDYMTRHTYDENKIGDLHEHWLGGNELGTVNVHLNANQALVYARMRSNVMNPATGEWERSGDNWRTERQKNVVWSLIRQLRNLDMDKITKLVKEVMPMVATDLSYNDFIVKMAGYLDYKRYSVHSFSIPAPHTWIYGEGSYVEIFDFEANRKQWREFVYQ